MIELEVINEDHLTAPEPSQFDSWLAQLAEQLNIQGEVCIKVVDATESQYLNLTYRGKDQPTNVLSFPSEVAEFVESTHLGDLAICASVVDEEARGQDKPVAHHWAHMTIHGVLHLLGYDHIEDDDAQKMEALEISILSELGIDDPYTIQ